MYEPNTPNTFQNIFFFCHFFLFKKLNDWSKQRQLPNLVFCTAHNHGMPTKRKSQSGTQSRHTMKRSSEDLHCDEKQLADDNVEKPAEQPVHATKLAREKPLEVLIFTDGGEPGEPLMYIKPFSELSENLQRRMRDKHTSYHEVDEEKHEMWENRISRLVRTSSLISDWMATRHRTPLLVVSSFTWGQC